MKYLPALLSALTLLTARAEETSSLSVSIQTPHPGYGLEIVRVDNTEEHTAVLAKVLPPEPGQMYPMVISETSDSVEISGPLKPVKLHLLNRSWDWGEEPAVDSEAAYLKKIGPCAPVAFDRAAKDDA